MAVSDCNTTIIQIHAPTHVTQGLVLRLRLWDLFRWMLAVNSTVLSDDLGLKHFNAQE